MTCQTRHAALTLTPRERNRFAAVMFATLETIDAEFEPASRVLSVDEKPNGTNAKLICAAPDLYDAVGKALAVHSATGRLDDEALKILKRAYELATFL